MVPTWTSLLYKPGDVVFRYAGAAILRVGIRDAWIHKKAARVMKIKTKT
jgi:hypothetical protein